MLALQVNPNYPKAIKMNSPFLHDLDGFRTVHDWHRYLTWGLMSKFCPSPMHAPLSDPRIDEFWQIVDK